MAQTRITFLVEANDPAHDTGLTEERFVQIHIAIANLGGEDIKAERVGSLVPIRSSDGSIIMGPR